MSTQDAIKRTSAFIRNSATIKILSIGILVLVLLIPASMISSLMYERQSRRNAVVLEISEKWGGAQTVAGPFFTVPYKALYQDKEGVEKVAIRYLHLLPKELEIEAVLDPQVRYRSIYEAVLYNAQIEVSGSFVVPVLSKLDVDAEDVLWDKAQFSVGITDMKGIQEDVRIEYEGRRYEVKPGLKTTDIAPAGISADIPLVPSSEPKSFSFRLNLNGSEQIRFVPVAEETRVSIESGWRSPSFDGAFLPVSRQVTDEGFVASWKVLHLNRNYPQYWLNSQYKVCDSSFGVRLIMTADVYQKSIRISKYSVMFIIFTFSAFFFAEIINKKRIHPIQYLLVGLAIVLFYVLQLAISEYIGFDSAYLIASALITFMITGYSHGILKNRSFTLTVFALLTVLYLYFYVVLQLEDYALLMGSLGLLAVLGTVMFITRKIDWYSLDSA